MQRFTQSLCGVAEWSVVQAGRGSAAGWDGEFWAERHAVVLVEYIRTFAMASVDEPVTHKYPKLWPAALDRGGASAARMLRRRLAPPGWATAPRQGKP